MAEVLDALENELMPLQEVVSSDWVALEPAAPGGLFESEETLGGVEVVVGAKI